MALVAGELHIMHFPGAMVSARFSPVRTLTVYRWESRWLPTGSRAALRSANRACRWRNPSDDAVLPIQASSCCQSSWFQGPCSRSRAAIQRSFIVLGAHHHRRLRLRKWGSWDDGGLGIGRISGNGGTVSVWYSYRKAGLRRCPQVFDIHHVEGIALPVVDAHLMGSWGCPPWGGALLIDVAGFGDEGGDHGIWAFRHSSAGRWRSADRAGMQAGQALIAVVDLQGRFGFNASRRAFFLLFAFAQHFNPADLPSATAGIRAGQVLLLLPFAKVR